MFNKGRITIKPINMPNLFYSTGPRRKFNSYINQIPFIGIKNVEQTERMKIAERIGEMRNAGINVNPYTAIMNQRYNVSKRSEGPDATDFTAIYGNINNEEISPEEKSLINQWMTTTPSVNEVQASINSAMNQLTNAQADPTSPMTIERKQQLINQITRGIRFLKRYKLTDFERLQMRSVEQKNERFLQLAEHVRERLKEKPGEAQLILGSIGPIDLYKYLNGQMNAQQRIQLLHKLVGNMDGIDPEVQAQKQRQKEFEDANIQTRLQEKYEEYKNSTPHPVSFNEWKKTSIGKSLPLNISEQNELLRNDPASAIHLRNDTESTIQPAPLNNSMNTADGTSSLSSDNSVSKQAVETNIDHTPRAPSTQPLNISKIKTSVVLGQRVANTGSDTTTTNAVPIYTDVVKIGILSQRGPEGYLKNLRDSGDPKWKAFLNEMNIPANRHLTDFEEKLRSWLNSKADLEEFLLNKRQKTKPFDIKLEEIRNPEFFDELANRGYGEIPLKRRRK